jgi:hypothetical protein
MWGADCILIKLTKTTEDWGFRPLSSRFRHRVDHLRIVGELTTRQRAYDNAFFSQFTIVGNVWGVWPMCPPGKTRADFGEPYSSKM